MQLYSYFRSSTSFRVRIALNLKGLTYDYLPRHLVRGEQRAEAYLAVNPQGLVPTLITDTGTAIPQSLAILEYLDEYYPQPPLLPGSPEDRARIRGLAYAIACDLHPINNLRIQKYLANPLGCGPEAIRGWVHHWTAVECTALEKRLAAAPQTSAFCHGDAPTLADLCLAAQVVNNTRFGVDMTPYPIINRIHARCMALEAFERALPSHQPDAE